MSPRRQILKLKLAAMLGLNSSFDADCYTPPLLSMRLAPSNSVLRSRASLAGGLDQVLDVLAPSDFFPCRT